MIIGNGTFYNCENLTSVEIPPLFSISGCTSLTSIKIPKGVKYIGESAFYGCHNLKSIVIPDSINFIDHHAFACCANLDSVTYYGETQPQIGKFMLRKLVFKNCPQLKRVKVLFSYKSNHFCEKKYLNKKGSILHE